MSINLSPGYLLASFIFGVIGIFLAKWAKQEGNFNLLFIGLGLMFYPYFVENIWLVWGIGFGLCGLAYWMKDR
ncbi:MAG: hypothetical protein ABL958_00860 [Bdellovibrionia bacterium]